MPIMPSMAILKPWHPFNAAPHRSMFFGGAIQTIAAMLWWLLELFVRYGVVWHPVDWPIAPAAVHSYLLIYGLFPFFIFGFLMTVFPRWLNGNEILKQRYMSAFLLLILGGIGFYVGLLTNHNILPVALFSTLLGWGISLYLLLRVQLLAAPSDKPHTIVILAALSLGWCGQAAFLVWFFSDNLAWLHFSIQCGLWLFLLPVFACVAHRMIPFFTSSALPHLRIRNPSWPLWVMLVFSMTHGLLQLVDAHAWLWLCDAPLAIAVFYLTYAWGSRHTLHIPLLAILHIGIIWLGIAMALSTMQSFVSLLNGGIVIWGLAPLHALTIGFFTTLMIGMATRVTLGHSGLPMKVDTPIKLMFAGIQLAAMLRVITDIATLPAMQWLYIASTVIWLACFVPWVLRFLPVYWQMRTDGKPG